MEENAMRQELAGLVMEITAPRNPQPEINTIGAQEHMALIKTDTRTCQELLDHLRVSLKYVLFDLEATRRENGYLRKMIELRA